MKNVILGVLAVAVVVLLIVVLRGDSDDEFPGWCDEPRVALGNVTASAAVFYPLWRCDDGQMFVGLARVAATATPSTEEPENISPEKIPDDPAENTSPAGEEDE